MLQNYYYTIVIFLSAISTQSNASKQGLSLPKWSSLRDNTLNVSSQRIIVSQNVCHCHSFPSQSNIYGQVYLSLLDQTTTTCSTWLRRLWPCPQMLDQGVKAAGSDKRTVLLRNSFNRTVHIRHQCRKITVLSCHKCLINTRGKK